MHLLEKLRTINAARRSYPIDIVQLLKKLDIPVREYPLPDGITGQLRRKIDTFSIVLQTGLSLTTRRFVLAHMLGHYILHQAQLGAQTIETFGHFPNKSNTQIGRREETEANKFAVNLLLPAEIVTSEIRKGKPLSQLSGEFQVTERAMEIRKESLTA